ncbi:7392_t:CDS:2 [Funneliformis geosporum]|uniref:15584_t:CDS:1 n=1 Tax=Funneliformis geosporum TaxID=1117311 RepID=A0A9W4SC29_9GLOM|nr:15584_t:CDS:2 [Funneliformis geosporum]CAI2164957.1 7392_t:CDS:2 [Funneliformis geosporum]
MEEETTYNHMTEEESDEEILQNGIEEVITVDQEFAEKQKVFQETINTLQQKLELQSTTTDNIGDPLEEYFKIIKALSSWMTNTVTSTLSSSPFLPLTITLVTDLDTLNTFEENLSNIEIDIISNKQIEYNQLSTFSTKSDSFSQLFFTFDFLWQTFNSLIKLGKLKLQELKWVIELKSNVEQVEVEIKKVEAMLEGVEDSRKKNIDDGGGGGGGGGSSLQGSINSINFDSSSDVTVTGIVFSSSLLDEWYTKVVAVEELVQDVNAKVKEVTTQLGHERFRAPVDLFDHINLIINNNVPELKSKIAATKQALAHDRHIGRWFDGANEADKWILETLNRVKEFEVPDFINKNEWSEEEQNLESKIAERRNMIEELSLDSKSNIIDELKTKANDIIFSIKDSNDTEDQAVIELMTKQLKNLNERLTKLNDFITLLLSQTTTERYSIVLNLLNNMQGMRNQMTQIRKTILEHNDADLVANDVKDVENQISNFEEELLNDDSVLAKVLRQKHATLLLTIQKIRVALAENKLQMAAYLSPSSPTSGSEFDRLRVVIQDRLELFYSSLITPPTYMIDSDNDNEEPERIHGLTCNDDHVEELTERYSNIESELITFERTLWVEFWFKSDPTKKARSDDVVNNLEKKFNDVKGLMKDRKKDLITIKEGREFAKSVNAIRNQLDEVKGKMRRGDTTIDASLQELDDHMDQKYKEAFDEQLSQHKLVKGWIEEVRVWLREAIRIRGWMNERVEILQNVPKVDPFQEGGAPATQEQVDEWQKEHDELEREVEKFDSGDVTRLRAHVKGMVGSTTDTTDEMSPADAMTIAITFETLKVLDQLLGKLRVRENELALLALRVQWEREYGNAMNSWNRLIDEINGFINNRGRWQLPISPEGDGWFTSENQLSQNDVTLESKQIYERLVDYITNIIPPTTEIFDELLDTSLVELPEHLLERQENIEESDKAYLEEYFDFAKDVLTQRKQVLDYVHEVDSSHVEGVKLKDELILEESNPRGGSVEKKFIARVIELNKRVEKSWNSMAQQILYPDHEKHNESENEMIRQAIIAYNEKLKALLGETDEALKNYQRALKLVETANECKKEADRLKNWIVKKDDYVNKRKFDVFQEPCKFTSQDIDNYVTSNAQIAVDIHNFDEEELKDLRQKVAALITEVKAIGTKCVNTDELEGIMKDLDDKLNGLRDDFQVLQSREPDEVNAAKKRLIWEDSLKKSNHFLDDTTKESKTFITSKATWKPETPEDTSAHEMLNQEYSSLEGKVKDFISNEIVENKSNYDAFIEASEKLDDKDRRNHIENRQSKLESDVDNLNECVSFAHDLLEQRAAVVEYMSEATKLDNNAVEIKKSLIEAEKNVSKGPSEIDFENQLKDFNQDITALWDERGSKLPYPTSHIIDKVKVTKNTVIEAAAQKRLSSLESAREELDKLYETYQTSLALQQRANECINDSSRLQDWISERRKKLEENKVDPLAEDCPWNESEVQEMKEQHEEFLKENTKVDIEDLSQIRRNLETLLEDIKKANCKSVDQKPLREALEELNKKFGELQSESASHQLDLSVLQSRAKWEDQYGPGLSSLDELTNQVNEFISERARWSPEKANPETDLNQEFTNIKQKVSEFEEQPLTLTKSAYNDMLSSIKTYLSKQPPKHISDRQLDFAERFDNLTKREDLSKQVLDQRDATTSFINQANHLEKEGESLKEQLKSAEESGTVDPSLTDKLVTYKGYLDDLKKNFADKIAYPIDSLATDDVNAPIKQVVDARTEDLAHLSKELDELLKSYQETMKLSEQLENALSKAKQLEDEFDSFIFDKAAWQPQEGLVEIKDLLAELNDINEKVSEFDKNTVIPVNNKVDDYEKLMAENEKGVPEHIADKYNKLKESINELNELDKYARSKIDQRKAVMGYMADGSRLEKEAEQIQQILLSNEPHSPGGEGNTVSNAVNSFSDRVQILWNDIASQIQYPTYSIENIEKVLIGRIEDSNNHIKGAVNAQNESLTSLANSLNKLLETYQNVLRRKKMIEAYIIQANDVASWIQPKLDVLGGILNDETLGELSNDKIHGLIGEVDDVEAALQAYHSAFGFAKSLANKLIEDMVNEIEQGGDDIEDIKVDLELVRSKQEEIDALWDVLQSDVHKTRDRLDQALKIVDFKEKTNEFLNKVNDMSSIISSTSVEDVSGADLKDWQIKLNSLEQGELFSLVKLHDVVQGNLKENHGALSDKESKELEGLLREVANSIGELKKLMNDKIDEVEAYQSLQIANAYMSRVSDLQRWIENSIATFADAKPRHGIMVGNSDELNKNNFDELRSIFEQFSHELPDRVDQLESIRTDFQDISLKDGIRELQDILKWQANLDQSWDNLDLATGEFKNFIDKTENWHDRHDSIYHVENDILGGLEDRINGLSSIDYDNLETEVKELDDNIKKAKPILDESKLKASQMIDDPDDLIDLTNRENFEHHYNEAINRLNELTTSFHVALTAAHNASLLAAFRADADRIIRNCYEGIAIVKSRHEDLENFVYYALEIDALETKISDAIDGYSESEEKFGKYDQQVNVDLKKEAENLIEMNPESNKDRVLNIFSKVTAALEQFSDAVALERREIELSRRVLNHAKTAVKIKNWIGPCKMAVLNIQTATIEQENEIVNLEEKVEKFQSFIDDFKNSEADSAEIDAPQEETNPKFKDCIRTRTNRVLEDWYGLKDLLANLRTSLNASKESLEVSRTIKEILVAIGQVKERVLNIESFITGEGIPRLPTKDDIEGGELELDEIQAEIDHILGTRIISLDEMINNLTENDSGYVQQRHGIAEALTNLASIIDNKRNQLTDAHNLALFGTKADAMNALMSSLLEVVDLATTTMDGSPISLLSIIELQSRKIELESKYNYYYPRINQQLEECSRLADPLRDDWRVHDRLNILKEQWTELIEVANAKKEELLQLLVGEKPKTRHARSHSQIISGTKIFFIHDRHNHHHAHLLSPFSRVQGRKRGVVSPGVSPSRNPMYRPSSTSRIAQTPSRLSPSPTPGSPGSPRRPPIRLIPHNINNYVPDPKDQLDVEVARIVNACPVKIKVSMVEGEPGKYMFGEVEPKLCYCRILRSRMVMVRVGGGWAELSKFLVEHANLEQKYIPKARSFVGFDETDSTVGGNESYSSPSFYEANLRIIPKGHGLRIEGSTGSGPLALKRMSYTRKVSNQENENDRSRIGKPKSSLRRSTSVDDY